MGSVPSVPTPDLVIACLREAIEKFHDGDLVTMFRAVELARNGYELNIKARYREGRGVAKKLDNVRVKLEKLEEIMEVIKVAGMRMPDGRLIKPPL